jgi:DNA-binding transcriptional LysR family regulator
VRPKHDLDVAFLRTAEQLRRLRDAELDLALIRHTRDEEGIDVEPVYLGEPLSVFTALGHRLAARGTVGPGDLDDDVLIVSPRESDPAVEDRVTAVLATAGHHFRNVQRRAGEDTRSLLLAVAEQHGIGLRRHRCSTPRATSRRS